MIGDCEQVFELNAPLVVNVDVVHVLGIESLDSLQGGAPVRRVNYYWLLRLVVHCDLKVDFLFNFELFLDVNTVHHVAFIRGRIVYVHRQQQLVESHDI